MIKNIVNVLIVPILLLLNKILGLIKSCLSFTNLSYFSQLGEGLQIWMPSATAVAGRIRPVISLDSILSILV